MSIAPPPSPTPLRVRLGDARLRAALGALTIAFSGIFVKLSSTSPSTAAVYRCAFALPVLFVLARREDRRLGPRTFAARRPALLAGVFFTGDLILWNASIGDVGAGLATVLANIQVLILPLVAWMLMHERPRRAQLLALPVAALGVLLISGVVEHGAYGAHPERGTWLGVSAGVAYVGFILLLRHGGADTRRVAGPLCDATLVAVIGSLIVGVAIGDLRLLGHIRRAHPQRVAEPAAARRCRAGHHRPADGARQRPDRGWARDRRLGDPTPGRLGTARRPSADRRRA
jgi:drug/metabolite transporter (DMT)-like permease